MQATPTKRTLEKIKMLLDYWYTHPNARIQFYASDMILYVDSDAAYLVAEKAKSRIAAIIIAAIKQQIKNLQILHYIAQYILSVNFYDM